jgi:hypothetical protein
MAMERGPLSINSENMFPIIKKWLYSDHDIFYRELISNGCDAITKLKKLDMMGDYELPEGYKARIGIEVDFNVADGDRVHGRVQYTQEHRAPKREGLCVQDEIGGNETDTRETKKK